MKLLDKRYAILHKPTGMFLAKYENNYKERVKGALGDLTPRAMPFYTKQPRFYSKSGASSIISRLTRTKKDIRKDNVKAVLFGSENCQDYEIVEIDVMWQITKNEDTNETS